MRIKVSYQFGLWKQRSVFCSCFFYGVMQKCPTVLIIDMGAFTICNGVGFIYIATDLIIDTGASFISVCNCFNYQQVFRNLRCPNHNPDWIKPQIFNSVWFGLKLKMVWFGLWFCQTFFFQLALKNFINYPKLERAHAWFF